MIRLDPQGSPRGSPHLKDLNLDHICKIPFDMLSTTPTASGEEDLDISAGPLFCQPNIPEVEIDGFVVVLCIL